MAMKEASPEAFHSHQISPKVVLVTGASSGIGRQFCLELSRCGLRVIAAARRTHLLRTLVSEAHTDICSIHMDVSAHEPHIQASISQAWQFYGRIDVLVNNAGFRGNLRSSLELDEDEWNKTMNTNSRGAWLVSKAVAKRMIDMKIKGSIINISSIASTERGLWPRDSAYASSKAAIMHLTKKMALELGAYNIRVNSIAPGLFYSEITAGLLKKPWFNKEFVSKLIPMGRNGMVHPDLTSLLLFLVSDNVDYVTGNVFVVDGGGTIPGIQLRSAL